MVIKKFCLGYGREAHKPRLLGSRFAIAHINSDHVDCSPYLVTDLVHIMPHCISAYINPLEHIWPEGIGILFLNMWLVTSDQSGKLTPA